MFLHAGVQDRCGKVFEELAAASCVLDDPKQRDAPAKPTKVKSNLPFTSSKVKLEKLPAAHALSLDLVMSMGLEMGSHSVGCWPHVFR